MADLSQRGAERRCYRAQNWHKISKSARIASLQQCVHVQQYMHLRVRVRGIHTFLARRSCLAAHCSCRIGDEGMNGGGRRARTHDRQKSILGSSNSHCQNQQALSHYSFRSTLLQKASVNQTSVRVVSEAYTTKQCNQCGYMNWTIGSSEVFSCKNCKVVCHRDVHSGRGIFIRSMSE